MGQEFNTIELSGIIQYGTTNDYFETIKLIQEDGYKIDLIGRFKELVESFPSAQFKVDYYVADERATKDQILEKILDQFYGVISVEFEQHDWQYSSWTKGTDYNTTFSVGGHDMLSELRQHYDRFLIIELKWK
jgi:hypothetical protein